MEHARSSGDRAPGTRLLTRGAATADPLTRPIRKPLPTADFVDHGTNAEMRWDTAPEERTSADRLFVRNHTTTPTIDPLTYTLAVHGDGLATPRGERDAVRIGLDDLRRLRTTQVTTVHECTGNGRRFFAEQQLTPTPGTPWRLGSVGSVTFEGVRLRDLLGALGLAPDAVDVMGTGLDPHYVADGVDHGPVRRPLPIEKALDDTLLAWGMNGEPLLPDHGFPLRLVVPGWVGIASIKWLGSLEVSRRRLTSPWNTTMYRMRGGDHPVDSPPLTVNPVRSAWELAEGAVLPRLGGRGLHGRSWSGAGRIRRVEVSVDGGAYWRPAHLESHAGGWTRWGFTWPGGAPGEHVLMARATDVRGRTQPIVARYNTEGYFFDAVVRHPVTVR